VEDEESLEASALIGELSNAVQNQINDFFPNSVVTAGIVVGSVFLSGDQLLRVEQLAVSSSSDFIDHSGLQIDEHGSRNVLSSTGLRKERVEGIVSIANGLIGRHLTIGLNSMFKAKQLPASVTSLHTSLTNMD